MYFIKQPVLIYFIQNNIKITYIKKKLYISAQTKKKLIEMSILGGKNNNNFQIYVNYKFLIIQPRLFTKKKNKQLCGFYFIKLKQFSQQVLNKQFKKIIHLKGIGYKVFIENSNLKFKIGYSHDVSFIIPDSIQVYMLKTNKFMCLGFDKDLLSQFIATIKASKKKDFSKGKGILFLDENVVQKEGKKNKK